MKNPKVGERVAVYGTAPGNMVYNRKVGEIEKVLDGNLVNVKIREGLVFCVHEKQCRRIKKKYEQKLLAEIVVPGTNLRPPNMPHVRPNLNAWYAEQVASWEFRTAVVQLHIVVEKDRA